MVAALVAGLGLSQLWQYIQYADGPGAYVIKLAYRVMHGTPQMQARRETTGLRDDVLDSVNGAIGVAELLRGDPELKRQLEILSANVRGYTLRNFKGRGANRSVDRQAQERQRDFFAQMREYANVLNYQVVLLRDEKAKGAINENNFIATTALAVQLNNIWERVPSDVIKYDYVYPDQHLRETFRWPGTRVHDSLEERLGAQEAARRTSIAASQSSLSVGAKSYMASAMSLLKNYVPDYWPNGKVPILDARWSWWAGPPDDLLCEKIDDTHKTWSIRGTVKGRTLQKGLGIECVYFSEALTYLSFKLKSDKDMTDFIHKVAGEGQKVFVFVAEGVRENVAKFFRNTQLADSAVMCYDLSSRRLIYDENNPVAKHFAPYFSGDNQKPMTTDGMLRKVAREKNPAASSLRIEADDLRSFVREDLIDDFVKAKLKLGSLRELDFGSLGVGYEIVAS